MDETLKYYKVTGEGILQDVVLALKPEIVEETVERYRKKGYELTETERPADATVMTMNPAPLALQNYPPEITDPWTNVKRALYDGPNCKRCKNRFRSSEFCGSHYRDTKSCYRFKLEN